MRKQKIKSRELMLKVDIDSNLVISLVKEERRTSLDVEFLCELLEIVMGPLFRPQVQLLVEFLKVK